MASNNHSQNKLKNNIKELLKDKLGKSVKVQICEAGERKLEGNLLSLGQYGFSKNLDNVFIAVFSKFNYTYEEPEDELSSRKLHVIELNQEDNSLDQSFQKKEYTFYIGACIEKSAFVEYYENNETVFSNNNTPVYLNLNAIPYKFSVKKNPGENVLSINTNHTFLFLNELLQDEKALHDFMQEKSAFINHFILLDPPATPASGKIPEQIIYFGAPGTGKSHQIEEKLKELGIGKDNQFRVTVFPDYSYHDFVGHVMPVIKNDNTGKETISYDFVPGVFTKALERAWRGENVYLIIEEMSRGNIAGIFGDIFQLLDRDENGESKFGIDNPAIQKYLKTTDKIKLPANFNILGTVNTSDQNVFVMDTAFKRRFDFEYVSVKPVPEKNNFSFTLGQDTFSWHPFYQALNKFIVDDLKLPEDKQIGPFFLLDKENDKANLQQIRTKLLQYLWHDVERAKFMENQSLFQKSGEKDEKDNEKNYTSFSAVYNDLSKGKNVFFEKIIRKYYALFRDSPQTQGSDSDENNQQA